MFRVLPSGGILLGSGILFFESPPKERRGFQKTGARGAALVQAVASGGMVMVVLFCTSQMKLLSSLAMAMIALFS